MNINPALMNSGTFPIVMTLPKPSKEIDGRTYVHRLSYPLLSKKSLCTHFDCSLRSLRKNYLTNETLKELKVSNQRYRKVHRGFFTLKESKRIYEYFNIEYLKMAF